MQFKIATLPNVAEDSYLNQEYYFQFNEIEKSSWAEYMKQESM